VGGGGERVEGDVESTEMNRLLKVLRLGGSVTITWSSGKGKRDALGGAKSERKAGRMKGKTTSTWSCVFQSGRVAVF